MQYLKTALLIFITYWLFSSNLYACKSNAGENWEMLDDRGWESSWHLVCSKSLFDVENPNSTFRGQSKKEGATPISSELVIKLSLNNIINITRKDQSGSEYIEACHYQGLVWHNRPAIENSYQLREWTGVAGGTYRCNNMQDSGFWTAIVEF